MSLFSSRSKAEAIDSFLKLTASGMTVLALIFLIKATKYFVGADMADILEYVEKGGALLILIVGIPAFLRFKAIRLRARSGDCEADGFVKQSFKQAGSNTYSLTFVMMVVLEALSDNRLAHIPTEILLDILLGASLLVFAGTFFFLKRDGDLAEDEAEDVA